MAFKRSGVRFPSPPWRGNAGLGASSNIGSEDCHDGVACRVRRLLGCVAGIAQLVEHNLAKVGVAGSSPVSRSCCLSSVVGNRGRLAQLVRAPR